MNRQTLALAAALAIGGAMPTGLSAKAIASVTQEAGKPAVVPAATLPTIEDLLARIESLETRIASLEAALAGQPASPTGINSPSQPETRIIKILSIEPLAVDPKAIARATELEQAATNLERQAVQNQPGDKAKGSDRTKASKIADGYADEAKAKRQEAAKLRHDAETPKHRITGWNGSRTVVLTTDRDLSAALTRLSQGDFIGWSGQRTRLSDATDEYTVRVVTPAQRPPNFVDQRSPIPPATNPATAPPPPQRPEGMFDPPPAQSDGERRRPAGPPIVPKEGGTVPAR